MIVGGELEIVSSGFIQDKITGQAIRLESADQLERLRRVRLQVTEDRRRGAHAFDAGLCIDIGVSPNSAPRAVIEQLVRNHTKMNERIFFIETFTQSTVAARQ